jgi:hypothetical protein
MLEQFDFDESLRIFGVITDTTPRDAIRNIELQSVNSTDLTETLAKTLERAA